MSQAPFTPLDAVKFYVANTFPAPEVTKNGVRVTTHCMYPSNGLVRVYVKAGIETTTVSDEGEAVGEVLSAGINVTGVNKLVRHIVAAQGLLIEGGLIHTPRIRIEAMPIAILVVANAAKDVAQWFYEHKKIKRSRDFRKMLADYLETAFSDRLNKDDRIVGASNKPHKFANVVSFPNGRRLVIDAVMKDPASINSRVVANLDIRSNKNPLIDQRIVYDDAEGWSSADLNLLNVGAPTVPFSKASDVISRLAMRAQVA